MSTIPTELERFHRFIAERLAESGNELTPEDCLDIWRANHPSPEELAESVAAIQEGLEQARRGEGVPLDDFIRSFRSEKGISGDQT